MRQTRFAFPVLLIIATATVAMIFVFAEPREELTSSGTVFQSPLPTLGDIRIISPLPTPECLAVWPTSPAVACPWLATPTSVSESAFAKPTQWTPPSPPVATVTALPGNQFDNNSGKLLFVSYTRSDDEKAGMSSIEFVQIGDQNQIQNAPTSLATPSGQTFRFSQISTSPDGKYLAGVTATQGGDVLDILDITSNKVISTLGMGKYFGWHPNSKEILFYQDMGQDAGLWRFDVENSTHKLVAQPPTLDITGAAISPDGQLLAYGTNSFDTHQIWISNEDGSAPSKLLESDSAVAVWGWSPNGQYLLYTGETSPVDAVTKQNQLDLGSQLWLWNRYDQTHRSLSSRFLFGYGFTPVWSPTSDIVAFVGANQLDKCWSTDDSFRRDPRCVYRGTGVFTEQIDSHLVTLVAANAIDPSWFPDGQILVYSLMRANDQVDIEWHDLRTTEVVEVTTSSAIESSPVWAVASQ